MAITTAATTKVEDVPTLQKQLDAKNERRSVLRRDLQAIFPLTSPYAVHDGPLGASRADIKRAKLREPDLKRELDLLELECEELTARLQQAVDAEQQRRRKAACERVKAKLPDLDRALIPVMDLLQCIAVEDDQAGTGLAGGCEFLAMRIAYFRDWCRQEHLLD